MKSESSFKSEADGLEISKSGNLISCIVINEDGSESSLKLAVRSGGNKQ